MEIENDGSEVAREKPSNTMSFTVEDCLQAVNNSLKNSVQLMQELAGDVRLALDTQEQLNEIVDPFVTAIAHHHSTDSCISNN